MPNRPYLTSAEAATYCGFKTIGGIQQAVRRGKLKPAGRRGGTGTYVFATEDLDLFLTGGLQPHERLFVAPPSAAGPEHAEVKAALPRRTAAVPDKAPKPAPKQPSRKLTSPSPKPSPKAPPGRGRKPATDDDPVTRITRALSSGGSQRDKDGGKKSRRTAASQR